MGLTTLSEEQWAVYESVFVACLPRVGAKPSENILFLKGVFHVLVNGGRWRAMPKEYGNWHRIYQRFSRLSRSGVFERMFEALAVTSSARHLAWIMDGTIVQVDPFVAGKKRERTKRNRPQLLRALQQHPCPG
jgi:transposase